MPDPRAAIVDALRAAWTEGRRRAERRLEAGAPGVEVARLYARAADEVLTALWRVADEDLFPTAKPAERLSLLAVGGYGRGVLAPYSDLDLMFLRPGKPTARVERVTEYILHVLWDLGLKVGQASRSPREALEMARGDMTVRTTLLEARFVAGHPTQADRFLDRFRRQVEKADPRPFIAAKLAERDVRHARAGAVRYRVEPNIKDGKGGLRDLNTLFWIARSLAPDSPLGERALIGLLTPRERRLFEEAFDFLWRVRAHLHLTAGRAEEKLTFDLQPEVARRMGWRGRGDEPAVERFMRRYFIVARDVGALTRALSATLEARQQKRTLNLPRLTPARTRDIGVEGFIDEGGRLSVRGPEVFMADPVRLIELFTVADRLDLDLHPHAFSAVSRSLSLVTPRLRRDPRAAGLLLNLLARGRRPYRTLSLMNEAGLLGRFIPEWARIVGQTQFNMYHAYTVDEHTLQAIGVINDIALGRLKADHPVASEVMRLITDPVALYLAMLLHDVGKGGERGQLEEGAIAARRACERMGLEPRRTELVVWLVRHHLALSDYAQKRDPSDPATLRAFAELVGDPQRLRMLMVLTVADIRAVGPGVWNGWKGQLMRALYAGVEALFRGEDPTVVDPLIGHEALVARAASDGAAAEARQPTADDLATELVVAARDRPGLFADLAAVLAAAGADVTGARVATAPDGAVLDVFHLQDGAGLPYGQAEPRRLTRLTADIEAVARGDRKAPVLPARSAAHPRRAAFEVRPVVTVDPNASDTATVIEVSGADRPGLLAELARALADHGLSIRSAHVAGFGARVVDSFYVTTPDGPPPARRLGAVEKALTRVLEPAPQANGRRLPAALASARDVTDFAPRPGPRRDPGTSPPISPRDEPG